ncbi:16S rRNA (guanine(527)-N(7))-methyltransferase RsmG [Bordetella bronchiseptica]|uniref:16S rRNA (guanine(527)-N(7))-methyltransferase RsmG n=1 Tax=Bordetella bronchiseptica TaxID=518 RepID=UPI0004595061|nr:16S rRNA (guanine(527)-N(7))-methyltransferase RsmG [Bordetella bronchiseptica]AOB24761.1 16S rRNA (guanine(527)-N(7))-methyltransferase [Bordetella bronchiseptica]AZW41993.1 16S rRNA (guanine(527)-N(7))-methyltransferase RsmG [Bordetella bronchiseptica]KCV61656.1 16S rRNA (guanine(527)-N(7))-methyltransferase RsmG [Bordetella bronchiseptica 99-R-0433]MBN3267327.1 16S rRNA (guanine(527)-N(7))-methyltransferase RsmG [Bordetella bronchiseptica]
MSAVPEIPGGPARRLAQACDALGLPADAGQQQKLLRYVEQMQRWNRTYNLTAIRDPGQMLVQHLFDSLSVVAPLERGLRAAEPGARVKLFDVGSGGGLPGVVLAIMRAHWDVTCVDAVEKKTAFVRQMAGALGLPNLRAAHSRIEQLEPAQCDVVISRAFASLQDFAALAGRHVREGGTLVAMKGKVPDDEIEALQQHGHWTVERIEPLVVPELDAQRCLIWMRRSQGNI